MNRVVQCRPKYAIDIFIFISSNIVQLKVITNETRHFVQSFKMHYLNNININISVTLLHIFVIHQITWSFYMLFSLFIEKTILI